MDFRRIGGKSILVVELQATESKKVSREWDFSGLSEIYVFRDKSRWERQQSTWS